MVCLSEKINRVAPWAKEAVPDFGSAIRCPTDTQDSVYSLSTSPWRTPHAGCVHKADALSARLDNVGGTCLETVDAHRTGLLGTAHLHGLYAFVVAMGQCVGPRESLVVGYFEGDSLHGGSVTSTC